MGTGVTSCFEMEPRGLAGAGGGRQHLHKPPAREPERCAAGSIHSPHMHLAPQREQGWGGEGRGGTSQRSGFKSASVSPHLPGGGRQEASLQSQPLAAAEQLPATVWSLPKPPALPFPQAQSGLTWLRGSGGGRGAGGEGRRLAAGWAV